MKKIILLGNPNSGKTTLFNILTKSHRYTGNRIGVTVDAASGVYKSGNLRCEIIDLPGVYSLTPFTNEEKEVSDYLKSGEYDAVINIIDSTNIERSLLLTSEILELHRPTVLAFNFCDTLEKQGKSVNTKYIEQELGIKAVSISATKETGLKELIDSALGSASAPKGNDLSKDIKRIEIIAENAVNAKAQAKALSLQGNYKADRIILHKLFAYPILLVLTLLIFIITFSGITGALSEKLDELITVTFYGMLKSFLIGKGCNIIFTSLICDGILRGIGSVLSFLPQIAVLSFLMAVFEDSGYLSRTAYICDAPLRRIGLQGKCFFCVMMGFGCSVPAMLSSRVLENRRDRVRTLLLIPFIPCSAKLPLIVMMTSMFFRRSSFGIAALYCLSIMCGVIYIYIIKLIEKRKAPENFILEMPPYRVPGFKSIKYSVITRVNDFLIKAGTVIVISSVFLWLLSSFDTAFHYTLAPDNSILYSVGKMILFIFKPLGFTEWTQSVSIISGLIAREAIVSSLEILYNGSAEAIKASFTVPSSLSFMTFSLLFLPCAASLTTLRKELKNNKAFILTVIIQSVTAYAVSFLVYTLGRFIF